MIRCESITTTGERCRETRPAWLRLVHEDGTGGPLRTYCMRHMTDQQLRGRWIHIDALADWMARGVDG